MWLLIIVIVVVVEVVVVADLDVPSFWVLGLIFNKSALCLEWSLRADSCAGLCLNLDAAFGFEVYVV